MPKFETLDERCKFYEKNCCGNYLTPTLPALCRIDGRSFHSFTKGLKRPFDKGLSDLMIATTKFLVKETNSCWGYCQSDEISLGLFNPDPEHQLFFDGKTQKIISVTASLATYFFNRNLPAYLPSKINQPAIFDSRVWNVPNINEGTIYAKWRQKDATKNAITMAASTIFSHAELQGVNGNIKQEMLHSKGINFNDYEPQFRRGTIVRRVRRSIPFSAKEIEVLPLNHYARKNPDLMIERNLLESSTTRLTKITNAAEFLFFGEDPVSCITNKENKDESV